MHRSFLSLPVAALCALSTPAQGQLSLVREGASDYRIVISRSAIPSERYAAEELRDHVEKISGCRLPIITDQQAAMAREIVLGAGDRLGALAPALRLEDLGTDGFAWRTEGERLYIVGGRPRGTLNGVYTFLEEQLGVRWFAPDCVVYPRKAQLEVARLDKVVRPRLEYREVFWTMMLRYPDLAARHRLNGQHYNLKEKHGGRFAVYYPFVHSFDDLIPRDLYQEHPEYFSYINGRRATGYVQRCLSNPEVLKLSIAKVRQWIRDHPEATIISVSQNDTMNWCQCEPCKALDDAEGSPAASLLRYVNAIAADIEGDFPRVRIDTLAYQYTRKPPKTIRPHKNVIIRLCSIECCFAHSLEDCPSPENRRFREDILAWQPVAPLLYVWDYTPNFGHYQQPFPNFDVLQANVRFFADHGVKGLFEQGNYSPGGHGEMEPLRAYLLAKLLWDPGTDVARHTREFLDGYYQQAAPFVREYLDLLQSQVRGKDRHAHIFDPATAGYLNDEFLAAAEGIWDRAEKEPLEDQVRFRVRLARLPVWYVKLATQRVTGEERTRLFERFLAVAQKAGISHISESRSLEDWARQAKP